MNPDKKYKLLFPIYHFLPCATTHIHRVMRFLNHLAQTDRFDITVLTCKNPNDILYDDSLIKQLDPRIKVVRTNAILFGLHNKSRIVTSYLNKQHVAKGRLSWRKLLRKLYALSFREIFNFINFPDNCIGWLPFAYFKGKKLIDKERYEIILTTGPPFTNFILSALLKTNTAKLVLDYRDPWKNNYYLEKAFRFSCQLRASRKLETYVLGKADCVIANTSRMLEFIKEQNRRSFSDGHIKTAVIYNGYAFSASNATGKSISRPLTFLHSGRFHGKYRTPKYLLEAIRELIDDGHIDSQHIRMVFLGSIKPSDFELFNEIRTDDFCEFTGMVPHAENLRRIREADCLVVVGGNEKADGIFVPSKIYEYLQTRNLILGLLPKGEAYDILSRAGGAILVPPDSVPKIKEAILRIFENSVTSQTLDVERDWGYLLRTFDASRQAKKLEVLLDALLTTVDTARGEPGAII